MTITCTLHNIHEAAATIWRAGQAHKVWAFGGDMGAGKTTFIHALCQHLGVTSATGSPTYAIINEYLGHPGTIYHMDLYRLADEEEALQAGVEDALYSGHYCFVEWPNRAPGLFPPGTLYLNLVPVGPHERRITLSWQQSPARDTTG